MQQERDVVILNRQIVLIHVGGERQIVELFGLHQRTRRIMDDFAVLHVAGIGDLRDGFALRKFHDRMIKFAADDKIEIGAGRAGFPPA